MSFTRKEDITQETIRNLQRQRKISNRDAFLENYFGDLHPVKISARYIEIDRVNHDETKCVVRIADNDAMFKTKFGFCLVLNRHTVCWLKPWQVSLNYYGNEVLLFKKHFFPSVSKLVYDAFPDNHKFETFDEWLQVAKNQREMLIEDCGEIVQKYPCYWKLY